MKPRYKKQEVQDAYSERKLPIDRPVVVYYRQSTTQQVGNVSTAIQQEDLPVYLQKRGWPAELITVIDDDAGISGTKPMEERPGAAKLLDMIENRAIGAICVVDVDRLNRDQYGVQSGRLLQMCKENDVLIVTPSKDFDFNGRDGKFYERMYKWDAERAGEYLEYHVHGKLVPAKRRMRNQGQWVGSSVPTGYCIGPDKRYVVFEPVAAVVRQYFDLVLQHGGNIRRTAKYIRKHGLALPDFESPELLAQVPGGCKFFKPLSFKKDEVDGRYYPDHSVLRRMITNVAYIGHWSISGIIARYKNHPALVDESIFMQTWNLVSPYDFEGNPNPYFARIRLPNEESKTLQQAATRPLFEGLLCFQDKAGRVKPVSVHWDARGFYSYCAFERRYELDDSVPSWLRRAEHVDGPVSAILRTRLAVTFDTDHWQKKATEASADYEKARKKIEKEIARLEGEKQSLLARATEASKQVFVDAFEAKYEAHEAEQQRLAEQLEQLRKNVGDTEAIANIRSNFWTYAEGWPNLPYTEKRKAALHSVKQIVAVESDGEITLTVHWTDGEEPGEIVIGNLPNGWLRSDDAMLLEMADSGKGQVEIAEAFPTRTWNAITKRYTLLRGEKLDFPVRPIHVPETYTDYLERLERQYNEGFSGRFTPEESDLLSALLDAEARQLQIAAAFPGRNWRSIREHITALRGHSFVVPGIGEVIKKNESYRQYVERVGAENAETENVAERVKMLPLSRLRFHPDPPA